MTILSTRERDLEDAASVVRRSAEFLSLDVVEMEIVALSRALPDVDVAARHTKFRVLAGT